MCRQPLIAPGKFGETVVFHCSHAFHAQCLNLGGDGNVNCYLCQASSTRRQGHSGAKELSSAAASANSERGSAMSMREFVDMQVATKGATASSGDHVRRLCL